MQIKKKLISTEKAIKAIIAVEDEVRIAEIIGDHLSDKEFIRYAMGEVLEEERDKIDRHLCTCWECNVEAERLSNAYATLKSPQWGRRFDVIEKDFKLMRALRRASEEFTQEELLVAHNKEEYQIWDWHNNTLSISILQDANGNWIFWFSSNDLSLQDQCFSLKLVSVERKVVLQKVSQDEVGAEIIIPSYERPSNITKLSFDIDSKSLSIQND